MTVASEPAEPLPVQVVVLAKRPEPGRVKTRLTPPYAPRQAAELAAAALTDTLDAVDASQVAARVLAFDGAPRRWLRPGYSVVTQCAGGLDARLTAAVRDAYEQRALPVLLVGMDTPQLTALLLEQAASRLLRSDVDAVLGPATDGGFWLVGMREPHAEAFADVPMSTVSTFQAQHRRLLDLELRTDLLGELTDVDDIASARAVASTAPATRFARHVASLDPNDAADREEIA